MKTGIIVVGSARSGTSAVTRVVNLLGAQMAEDIIPANEHNVTGFWENQRVIELHDNLLHTLGNASDVSDPLPPAWEHTQAAKRASIAAVSFILESFWCDRGNVMWVMKDPRVCRLIPVWTTAAAWLGIDLKFIHIYRLSGQLESLAKWGWSKEKAISMIATHHVAALQATDGLCRTFMFFEQLLLNWRSSMTEIADVLKIDWVTPIDQAAEQIDAFLDPSLKHN
jgi:hypothetical protein